MLVCIAIENITNLFYYKIESWRIIDTTVDANVFIIKIETFNNILIKIETLKNILILLRNVSIS